MSSPQQMDTRTCEALALMTRGISENVAPFIANYLAAWKPYKSSWNYEDGCVFKGALDLHAATGLSFFFDFVYREVSGRIAQDGTIANYDPEEFNIDNVNAGKALFALLAATGEPRFRRAIEAQAAQLARHPRTRSGNYWHKNIYPHQVWLDGLYMAQPFQLAFARLQGRADLAQDTLRQFAHVRAVMRDARTGLFFHGWDESRTQRWANPETGCSPHIWARAMGWFVMAMIDCLELELLAPKERGDLRSLFAETIDALRRTRTPNGLWLQVIDTPGREANYEETSASLMIAYAMMKGERLGYLAPAFADLGKQALATIAATRLNDRELSGICAVAGLGGTPYRDGSFAYYVSEPVVANDPKGVGALFMAIAERLRPVAPVAAVR